MPQPAGRLEDAPPTQLANKMFANLIGSSVYACTFQALLHNIHSPFHPCGIMSQPQLQGAYIHLLEIALNQLYQHHLTTHEDCTFQHQQPNLVVAPKHNPLSSHRSLSYHHPSTAGSPNTFDSQATTPNSLEFIPYDPTKAPEPRNRQSNTWKPPRSKADLLHTVRR